MCAHNNASSFKYNRNSVEVSCKRRALLTIQFAYYFYAYLYCSVCDWLKSTSKIKYPLLTDPSFFIAQLKVVKHKDDYKIPRTETEWAWSRLRKMEHNLGRKKTKTKIVDSKLSILLLI